MSKFSKLKQILKEKAASIRLAKNELKEHQREHGGYDGGYFKLIKDIAYEFRHHHIAYSLLKGKKYEEIEQPGKENVPNMDYIEEIRNAYTEDVCVGQE